MKLLKIFKILLILTWSILECLEALLSNLLLSPLQVLQVLGELELSLLLWLLPIDLVLCKNFIWNIIWYDIKRIFKIFKYITLDMYIVDLIFAPQYLWDLMEASRMLGKGFRMTKGLNNGIPGSSSSSASQWQAISYISLAKSWQLLSMTEYSFPEQLVW